MTSPALLRHLDPLVQPYHDLAKAFARSVNPATSLTAATHSTSTSTSTAQSVSSAVASSTASSASPSLSKEAADLPSLHAQHVDVFARDRNSGLVKQLSTHLLHLQMQRLTSTYLTLPLAALATLLRSPPASVEQRLSLLIVRGRITARIDGRLGLVEFTDAAQRAGGAVAGDDDGAANVDLLQSIDAQISSLLALRQRARIHAAALNTNPILIAKQLQSEKEEGAGGGGGGSGGGGGGGRGATAASDVARASILMRAHRGGGAAAAAVSEDEQLRMAMQHSLTEQ